MTPRFKRVAQTLAVAGAACAMNAHAIPVDTDGVWSAVGQGNGNVSSLSGVGTNAVNWGRPFPAGADTPSSGFTFDGITGGDAPTDGGLFPLGVFTHLNNPVFLPSISGATLDTTLNFGGGNQFSSSFGIALDETRNREPCDPAGATVCPDVISLPDASDSETLTVGGVEYNLEIIGFSQDDGATIVSEFISEERGNNSATLFARLIEQDPPPPTPVPEPAPLGLVALGLLPLGVLGLRRREQT